MEVLSEFLQKVDTERLKIVVVGDSMIDEYYAIRVNRVSPEFPIPVLLSKHDKPVNVVPGGAANVCQQMKHWNVDVYLVSAFDKEHINNQYTFDTKSSVVVENWTMPRKKRFYDGDFPLDRWDIEEDKTNTPEWAEARQKLMINFGSLVKKIKPDVVILSDYGKGIFVNGSENISQAIIYLCNKYNIPTIVDPKSYKTNFWQNCTVLKPNADWAKGFCDKLDLEKRSNNFTEEAEFIQREIRCQSVVVTASGNGVCVFDGVNANFFPSPYLSQRRPIIRSVIGAGDCFCAFFAMAYALERDVKNAMLVAFNGASAYIEDKHNNPVTPYQFHKWFDPIEAKKVTLDQLLKIKSQLNRTWIWTNGCFDIIHPGHLKNFEEAKKLGDKLIVALNTDESIKMLKGPHRPILSYKDREDQLAHLQHVDFVVPLPDKTPQKMIEMFVPNAIVKGGDYKVRDIAGWEIVGEHNVHIVPLIPNKSTSKIVDKIKNELCGEYVWTPGRALVIAEMDQIEYFYRFEEDSKNYLGGGQVVRTVCGGLRRRDQCRPLDYVCDLKYLRMYDVFTHPERYA
jgi:D-beta-D-heptose 7-phosphate kinase/D-beta-D-heptose 1-phosphate adenosyltransferase